MTKIYTKLLVFLGAVICSLCLVFGLAACGETADDHKHTYATQWSKDESGHWHAATCEHTDEVKDFAAHSYEEGECTECGFKDTDYQTPHEHTFSDVWLPDGTNGHYRFATCHDGVKSGLEAHVDNNNDEICDVCEYDMHVHAYADEWSYDEATHWYAATCSHNLTKDNGEHDFVGGVCECGVTADEVAVYAMYKAAEGSGAYSFAIWLESLKNEGVTQIKVVASGDALYYYGNKYEVAYFAQRTVTAKATVGGVPLAHVWFSIQLQAKENITLAAVETDENGEAVITFTPVSYSGENNTYVLRIPEAMNIPGNNDESILPIPRKYVAVARTETLEIDENVLEKTLFNFGLSLSNDWSDDVRKDVHPYDRTYADLGNANSPIIEHGKDWTIEKTTGNGYMDYFNFEPYTIANYTGDDLNTRNTNAKKAAQGNYKLSFTTESNAKVYLVYWNYNLLMGGFNKNEDKSPADEYVGSISGIAPQGSAIEKKYTGENFVIVRISEELAASVYYLGLYTEKSCSVTISVERLGDYEEEQDELNALGVGEENAIENIYLPYAGTITIPLSNVSEGLYMLQATAKGSAFLANSFTAKIVDKSYRIWRYVNNSINGEIAGIVYIPADTKEFNFSTSGTDVTFTKILLEKYNVEITEENTHYFVPVTIDGSLEVAIDSDLFAGKNVAIHTRLTTSNMTVPTITAMAGGEVVGSVTAKENATITGSIVENAESIVFTTNGSNTLTAEVWVEIVQATTGSFETVVEFAKIGTATSNYVLITFVAEEEGDYILTVYKHEDMSFGVITVGVVNNATPTATNDYFTANKNSTAEDVESKFTTIHLNEGEEITFRVFVCSHRTNNGSGWESDISLPFKCNISIQKAD